MQNTVSKKKKGFAMGYVLIIIAVFTFLGAAMLMVSSSNMRTVTLPVRYVRYFYAAESGVQLVAQHLHSVHRAAVEDIVDDTTLAAFLSTPMFSGGIYIPGMGNATINDNPPIGGSGGPRIYTFEMPNMPAVAIMPDIPGPMGWAVRTCPEEPTTTILTISAQGIGHPLPDGTTSGGVIVSGDIRIDENLDWQLTNIRER